MKKQILVASLVALVASSAIAGGNYHRNNEVTYGSYVDAPIVNVVPVTASYVESIPRRVCSQTQTQGHYTRSYDQPQSNYGNILGGMLIGSVIGRGIDPDARGLRTAGAVIGGAIAAQNSPQPTYREQYVPGRVINTCETVYDNVNRHRFSHYDITVRVNGNNYVVQSNVRPHGNTYRVYIR